MSLEATLKDNLKTAMKAKDKVAMATIRHILSGITYLKAQGGHDEVTDEDVMTIITREAKKRRDAIATYQENGRPEMADQEQAELDVLAGYLPAQLDEEAVRAIVAEVIASVGATGPSDKGKVMGPLMARVKGQADGKMLNEMVTQALAS